MALSLFWPSMAIAIFFAMVLDGMADIDGSESKFSHDGDGVAEDQDQDQHGVVQQGTP